MYVLLLLSQVAVLLHNSSPQRELSLVLTSLDTWKSMANTDVKHNFVFSPFSNVSRSL